MKIQLKNYDLIIINSSGGKDSIVSIFEICRLANEQNYPKEKIVISHQDLGSAEWKGTADLVQKQADIFGLKTYYSKYRNKDGEELDLLEYVEKRGAWPSNSARYCTSEFKRSPGSRIVTKLTKGLEGSVLYVFGFRSEESSSRAKKEVLTLNKRLTTKKRKVYDFLPVHDWSVGKVWETIKGNGLPYSKCYELGLPRHSCIFCIFAPFNALVIAGKENPDLLQDYVNVEERINHSFTQKFSLKDVQDAVNGSAEVEEVSDWVM